MIDTDMEWQGVLHVRWTDGMTQAATDAGILVAPMGDDPRSPMEVGVSFRAPAEPRDTGLRRLHDILGVGVADVRFLVPRVEAAG
jgi:hypothetical protein